MTTATEIPTFVYRYTVISSDTPSVPVGTMLVDKRRNREHCWEVLNMSSGDFSCFVGKRQDRLCSACYAVERKAESFGHDCPHGGAS